MTTFGFSAYLKLVSLSERRQRTEVRTRLRPKDKAYDYHRSLRLCAKKFLVDDVPFTDVVGLANGITKPAERNSAKVGLAEIQKWRTANPGKITQDDMQLSESPNKLFSVKFTPDFKIDAGGEILSVHLWNTKSPTLIARQARGAMSLFQWFYSDLAILNLQNGNLIKLSDAEDHTSIGRAQMLQVETVFEKVLEELESASADGYQREAPPPPAL